LRTLDVLDTLYTEIAGAATVIAAAPLTRLVGTLIPTRAARAIVERPCTNRRRPS
jgi:hypothetical protein